VARNAPAESDSAGTATPAVERWRAPLLETLLAEPDPSPTAWLDLGPVHPGVIDALAERRARIVVADFDPTAPAADATWRAGSPVARALRARPVEHVLCWDLLNYLEPDGLGRLAQRLVSLAAPSCRIHALIAYSRAEMPAAPMHFRHLAEGLLESRAIHARIAAPRYSPKALAKAMPGLRVERTLLLNNGLQEFIFQID